MQCYSIVKNTFKNFYLTLFIVFKIKTLTVLLLSRSFENVIYDIAASSNRLLSTTDIRSLEKCYKKRDKVGLDITFLKSCRTFNIFPKFNHVDVPFSNRYDITYIKKRLLKNVLHKRDKEKKKLDAELTKKIQYMRSRCDGITWFLIYKLIQRNVKKVEKKIVETHRKKLCDLTRNRSLPFPTEDIITNLSDYRLNTEEIDLLKNGLNFSIPPKFIKKTDVFCQFDMIAKFLTKDIEENEVSAQLKSELTHLANCYIYKYTPSKSSLKKHKILQKLRSQNNIIITHPDKGNGIAVLNRGDYIKSMTELISDKKKF